MKNIFRSNFMKKLYKAVGSVSLIALMLMGSLIISCEQVEGSSSNGPSVFLNRSVVNPPTALTSWTALPNYASQGGGGGHSVYGTDNKGNGVFLSANWNNGSLGRSVDDGQTWSNVNGSATTFGSSYIKFLAFLDDTFWAVGSGGHIATSSDGLTWVAQTNPLTADAYGIAYDGTNTYMVVTDTIASSGGSGRKMLITK
jgi:hypothetical protein